MVGTKSWIHDISKAELQTPRTECCRALGTRFRCFQHRRPPSASQSTGTTAPPSPSPPSLTAAAPPCGRPSAANHNDDGTRVNRSGLWGRRFGEMGRSRVSGETVRIESRACPKLSSKAQEMDCCCRAFRKRTGVLGIICPSHTCAAHRDASAARSFATSSGVGVSPAECTMDTSVSTAAWFRSYAASNSWSEQQKKYARRSK